MTTGRFAWAVLWRFVVVLFILVLGGSLLGPIGSVEIAMALVVSLVIAVVLARWSLRGGEGALPVGGRRLRSFA